MLLYRRRRLWAPASRDARSRTAKGEMRLEAQQRVRSSGVGTAISGCADCGQMYVAFRVPKPAWHASLVLALEQSTDGREWVEAASTTFTPSGLSSRLLQVSNPSDQIRVRWTVLGGAWRFDVDVGSADPNWPRKTERPPAAPGVESSPAGCSNGIPGSSTTSVDESEAQFVDSSASTERTKGARRAVR